MKVLSKVQVLAERNGWSIARAQGFVDGEMSRRRGAPPSIYARVGIDDYCIGFRAGYFERRTSQLRSAATPLARQLRNTAGDEQHHDAERHDHQQLEDAGEQPRAASA